MTWSITPPLLRACSNCDVLRLARWLQLETKGMRIVDVREEIARVCR